MTDDKLANNIPCPKCNSENCYVNEEKQTDGAIAVTIDCDDCGFHDGDFVEPEELGLWSVAKQIALDNSRRMRR